MIKFEYTELFILILDISAIIHQLPCCYVVTTSNIGQTVNEVSVRAHAVVLNVSRFKGALTHP